MMKGVKHGICEFYNKKTFITEMLNVTTHPYFAGIMLLRVKEQRETEEKKRSLGRSK